MRQDVLPYPCTVRRENIIGVDIPMGCG